MHIIFFIIIIFFLLGEAEMSLWAKAQQLQGDTLLQVRSIYGEHFPLEVRHFLAQWLEEKMWYFLLNAFNFLILFLLS